MGSSPAPPEAEIRALHQAGDFRAAARRAIEAYGPEVLAFLVTTLRDEDHASDVFGDTCEDVWRGLSSFQWRASLRTWFYTLARHAASRSRRSAHRRPGRHVPLSEAGELAHQVRTRTWTWLRSEAQDKLDQLRNELPEEDHQLLVLRISRRMEWQDVARVMGNVDSPGSLTREAARLRKRFQLLKTRLRERAREQGLLD
ncbi:MAG: sigma-70 family RNA polymerase sigma factor [Myxococcota bacterium]